MSHDWQTWIVVACVLLAGWRVALRVWRGMTSTDGGGSCGGGCHACPTGSIKSDPPLVELDLFRQP